jgi:hypothetical protein
MLPGEAATVTLEEDVIVLGGDAIIVDPSSSVPLSSLTPLPPPSPTVSLESLLRSMTSSINDVDMIEQKLRDPEWVRLLESLSAEEFGSVVAHVNIDFDQTRVAAMLVPYVNGGNNFTCRYAAAAVKYASEWNRSNMAQRLVPLCVDIASNHELIRAQLTEWEQVVTGRDFEDALEAAAR